MLGEEELNIAFRMIELVGDSRLWYVELVSSFAERALRRSAWAVRVVPLDAEALWDARSTLTVDERIAIVEELTREQWAFAGLEIPSYRREEMPGRLLRPKR